MEGKGIIIAVVGSGRIPGKEKLLGESPINKVVEVLNKEGKKVGETDLTLKNPTLKERQEAKAQASLEKYRREQRMRLKIREANIRSEKKKDVAKKKKRNMIKKSRKRNRKKK